MKYLLSGLSLGLLACLGLSSIAIAKPPVFSGIGNIQNTKEM
jgi:hypothetical protein